MKAIKSTKKLGKKVPNTRFGFFTRALEAINTAAVNRLAVRRRRSRKKKPEQKAVSLNEKFIREAIKSTKTAVNKLAVRRRRPRKKNAVFTFDKLTKPKRTSSGYFVFMEEFRKTCKEEFPENISTPVVNKAGSWRWKSLSDAEKAAYVVEGEERKTEYTKNLQDYNDKMGDDDVEKGSKKKKAVKDPNKPKRPATPYFVFMEGFRKTHKEEFPENKSVFVVGKAGGAKWRSLSDDEKAPYVAEAEERKAAYTETLQDYYNGGDDVEEEECDFDFDMVDKDRKFVKKGKSVSSGSDYNYRPGRERGRDRSSSSEDIFEPYFTEYYDPTLDPLQKLVNVQPTFANIKAVKELKYLGYVPEYVFINTEVEKHVADICEYVDRFRQRHVHHSEPGVQAHRLIRFRSDLLFDIRAGTAASRHYYIPSNVEDFKNLIDFFHKKSVQFTAHPSLF